jgi:hypothetical protein
LQEKPGSSYERRSDSACRRQSLQGTQNPRPGRGIPKRLSAYDTDTRYTPKALEPYDALPDRFVRAVECALRDSRRHELAEFAEQSDTTRTLLNPMEKLGLVSHADHWLEMRNIRNRIVHDYLPEQTAQMFAEISGVYGSELLSLRAKLRSASSKSLD